ncbi:histone-lysine N-trimethyltransferase SMYD5-like [Centruroides vittatus]|uniref:histone-lysine N-trimethyltransferase SMYD5-like n=1 Tax=Centruroides vittatus TaxID=120091 RepID=UPI00350EC347
MDLSSSGDVASVEVREIGGSKGKGLFALRKFKTGDVIFEEKPLVCCQFLWNQVYGYLACDYCMRPLETAEKNARRLTGNQDITVPYSQCCIVKEENHVDCPFCEITYCTDECRRLAWEQYHQNLCLGSSAGDPNHPLEKLQDAWRNIHYPPETASIMLIANMIATVKQAKDKAGAVHLFSQFCHKTVNEEEEIAHRLLGGQFQTQIETLRELTARALYEDYLHHWFTPEGFRSLMALVGTNSQGIGTSSISAWVKNCDLLDLPPDEREKLDNFIDKLYDEMERETGPYLNNEGSGLYPLQSSCNHSCVPNAEATFPYSNFALVMEAIRDIEPGEEILVSYLDECMRNRSRHSRIKLLRENYLFTCTCPKCEAQMDDPDITSDDDENMEEDNVDHSHQ